MIRTERTPPQADDNIIKDIAMRAMAFKDTIDEANEGLKDVYAEGRSRGVPIPELKVALNILRMDKDKRDKLESRDGVIDLLLATLER